MSENVITRVVIVVFWTHLMTPCGSTPTLAAGKRIGSGASPAGHQEREERFSRKYDVVHVNKDDWKPMDYGHPMRDDPTLVYVPPVLDPVHYGIESAEPLWPISTASPVKAVFDVREISHMQEGRSRAPRPRPSSRNGGSSTTSRPVDYLAHQSWQGKTHLPRKPVVPHPALMQLPPWLRNQLPQPPSWAHKVKEATAWMNPAHKNAAAPAHVALPPAHNRPAAYPTRAQPAVANQAAPAFPQGPTIDRFDVQPSYQPARPLAVVHSDRANVSNQRQRLENIAGRNHQGAQSVQPHSTPTAAPTVRVQSNRTTDAAIESNRTPIDAAGALSAQGSADGHTQTLTDDASGEKDNVKEEKDERLARARTRFSSFIIQQGHSKVKMYGTSPEESAAQ